MTLTFLIFFLILKSVPKGQKCEKYQLKSHEEFKESVKMCLNEKSHFKSQFKDFFQD
jgi:hypothetical protein